MTDELPELKPKSDGRFRLSLLKDPLEVLAKGAAALLVIFYILGFLAVSAANYKHGITNFGLFRVRVVSAGVLVALFSGAAFWLWEQVFGLGMRGNERERLPRPLSFKILLFLLTVRFTSAFLGTFMFAEAPSAFAPRRIAMYMVSAAVIAILPLTTKRLGVWFSILCWVMVVVWIGAEAWFQLRAGVDHIFLWFLTFAVMADATRSNFKLVNTFRDVNWLMLTTDLAVIPILFGLVLYERIPPRFGGGKPVAVVFQFSATSPIDGAAKDKFWLLDEGDSGFYVLRAPEDKKGIFLPRGSVAAIYYDAGSDAAQR